MKLEHIIIVAILISVIAAPPLAQAKVAQAKKTSQQISLKNVIKIVPAQKADNITKEDPPNPKPEPVIRAPVPEPPQQVASAPAVSVSGDKQSLMAAAGIAPSDYEAVDYIVSHESSWNSSAEEPNTHAYGLCQSLPASKMASVADDYMTNPVTQLKWCSQYAQKYGGWQGSYNFWSNNRWW